MPVILNDPKVRQRQRKWEARNRDGFSVKITMGFEELFDAFQSDCITQSQIAKINGVSRERIRQIYDKWFADLFDGKKGLDRVKACTIVRHAVTVERLSNILPSTAWKQEIFDILKSKVL